MFGVGQTDERDSLIRPILLERHYGVRSQRENHSAAACKLIMLITQARQLRAAIRSHKAAQERKHDRFTSAKTGKADGISVYVF